MNNRRDKKERMLAESFHGEWSEGVGAAFAREAARAARRRSFRGKAAATAAGVGLAAVLLLTLHPRRSAPTGKESPLRTVDARMKPAYEIISDEQLLAELRDQPLLALKRRDGSTEFVLLEN